MSLRFGQHLCLSDNLFHALRKLVYSVYQSGYKPSTATFIALLWWLLDFGNC